MTGVGESDGPAGDHDDDRAAGPPYRALRRADPRLAERIHAGLGDAATVVNVGAGAGNYEPGDRIVVAVEPSSAMRAQRDVTLSRAIDATADALPFGDGAFDAGMAIATVHQWPDLDAGLAELCRVVNGPIVVMTWDPDAMGGFWLGDYMPELLANEARRVGPLQRLVAGLQAGGREVVVSPLPVACDCTDGFLEAYCARPEAFLDPAVRAGQSAWDRLEPGVVACGLDRLRSALRDGSWDRRHGHLRTTRQFQGALRLVVSRPSRASLVPGT